MPLYLQTHLRSIQGALWQYNDTERSECGSGSVELIRHVRVDVSVFVRARIRWFSPILRKRRNRDNPANRTKCTPHLANWKIDRGTMRVISAGHTKIRASVSDFFFVESMAAFCNRCKKCRHVLFCSFAPGCDALVGVVLIKWLSEMPEDRGNFAGCRLLEKEHRPFDLVQTSAGALFVSDVQCLIMFFTRLLDVPFHL